MDPRVTPRHAPATSSSRCKPGFDLAVLFTASCILIEQDWLDHQFIADHTVGFEAVADSVKEWTPAWAAQVTGVPAARSNRRPSCGERATGLLLHARGIEHHTKGVQNVLAASTWPGHRADGKPGCGYSTITGQGNGQGGSTVRSATNCQGPGHREPRAPGARRLGLGLRGPRSREGPHRLRDHGRHPLGRDQRPALDLLQPSGISSPTQLYSGGPRQAGALRGDRLLPLRDGPTPMWFSPGRSTRRMRELSRPWRGGW